MSTAFTEVTDGINYAHKHIATISEDVEDEGNSAR